MARKKYSFSETKIARFVREGRGRGTQQDYKPWLTVGDVPSLGRAHRIYCPKVSREVHLLSDNEYFAFLLQWWDDDVIDIREQFPLIDRRETMEIAARCGVKHPVDPASQTLLVMTTDLVVTRVEKGATYTVAFAVKQAEDIGKKRVIEKLEIERIYWQRRGISWSSYTNEEVKNSFTANLAWILDAGENAYWNSIDAPADSIFLAHILASARAESYEPIRRVCLKFDHLMRFQSGSSLSRLRRLLASKILAVDLKKPNLQDLPVSEFFLAKNLSHLLGEH